MRLIVLSCLLLAATAASAPAQVGPLLWEESFESLDNWVIETGNGSWGWGNGELQYYHANFFHTAEMIEKRTFGNDNTRRELIDAGSIIPLHTHENQSCFNSVFTVYFYFHSINIMTGRILVFISTSILAGTVTAFCGPI